jgi:hypothetical protein
MSVLIVYVKDKANQIAPPVVIGPFQSRVDAFECEKKLSKNKGVSRIEVKDVISPF